MKYVARQEQIEALLEKSDPVEIFEEVFLWFGIDLADPTIGPGEIDPSSCVLPADQWVQIADIILKKFGNLWVLKWMSAGPSGNESWSLESEADR